MPQHTLTLISAALPSDLRPLGLQIAFLTLSGPWKCPFILASEITFELCFASPSLHCGGTELCLQLAHSCLKKEEPEDLSFNVFPV